MRSRRAAVLTFPALVAALAGVVAAPRPAHALDEVIADIRVSDNVRTDEATIRSIAGVTIGDLLEATTLDRVRERLHTSGLFAEINVFWEPFADGVRVHIVVREKFPWAPVPTYSHSPGDDAFGLYVGHGNLFGRGKRGLLGGKLSQSTTRALAVYEDPALFGSWIFFSLRARYEDHIFPEFGNAPGLLERALRRTELRSRGGEVSVGIAWFRKVKTSVGWAFDDTLVLSSRPVGDNPQAPAVLPAATASARIGAARANLTFDFRAREHAIKYGNALAFQLERGTPDYGSSGRIDYWKASAAYEHGVRFFRRHNLQIRVAGWAGHHLPFSAENRVTGTELRGFLHEQFAGDTQLWSRVEYHFPLFSVSKLDFRGVLFNDATAIWYRSLPALGLGDSYVVREDGRSFLPPSLLRPGFEFNRDVHTSAGAGLRFYLRTLAAPLLGVDAGYGVGTGAVRVVIVVGV